MSELSRGARIRDNGDGVNRKRLPSEEGLTRFDLERKYPHNSWAGERKDLYLPYLFLRAHTGDSGARPVVGLGWESPDILIARRDVLEGAPLPTFREDLIAGQPNTIYAHVWNLGQSSAPQTVVDFHWCAIAQTTPPHFLGQTIVSLGARGSGRSHALVKCPKALTPNFTQPPTGWGFENTWYFFNRPLILLVRAWDYTSDALGTPPWDAQLNRHVAMRIAWVVRD